MIDALAQSPLALTILFALSAFLAIFAIWFTTVERDRSGERIQSVADRRLNRAQSTPGQRDTSSLVDNLRKLVNNFKLLQSNQTQKIQERLLQAGIRSSDAMIYYFSAKLILPFALPALAFLLIASGALGDLSFLWRLAIVVGACLLGFYLPDIYITNQITKRQKVLTRDMPDALDLLVVCAEAGLSLDASLNRVSSELVDTAPEMADELALTAAELSFLPERKTALQNLATRTGVPAMKGVVSTLIQTEKYGTPLSQALRVLSTEFRDQRMMRAEEKAARLPAILTIPMIVFILPTLFIVLMGPAVIDIMDQFINRD